LTAEGLAAADRLVVPSAAFAAALAGAYHLRHPPEVIHNGRRAPKPSDAAAPPTFVLAAGRFWDKAKGAAVLDAAAAAMNLPLLAAGPLAGPNGAAVAFAHAIALGELRQEELAAHLRLRPIFVSTARYEPFGLAVLEAAQMSCPLVLSDIPTFRELWDGAAVFVDPEDAMMLAGVCNRIAADAELAERFGRRAAARAAEYSLDAQANRMDSLYRELMAEGRARRFPAA
jgi:glycosyltransferase involved in cell wall biosynthesis